jgi:hypothetical protein
MIEETKKLKIQFEDNTSMRSLVVLHQVFSIAFSTDLANLREFYRKYYTLNLKQKCLIL